MEIELINGSIKAIIDPLGGCLTNLSDEEGDILFPKRLLKTADGVQKQRGGCHVCLPNFGPGGDSGLDQHGFGRTETWKVGDRTESSILLTLKGVEGSYTDMKSVLTYQLGDNRIVMTLESTNNGTSAVRLAPAFHPYFALHDENDVQIDGETEQLNDMAEATFIGGASHVLETQMRRFTLESTGLLQWAKWTDRLGRYVCVEPTFGGFTFENPTPAEGELLGPGESRTYSLSITWA